MRTTALTFAVLASLSAAEAHPAGWDTGHPTAHRTVSDPTRQRDLDAPSTPHPDFGSQSTGVVARTLGF